jgi:peroxiredoxin
MGIAKNSQRTGLYMVSLKNKQWFYVLCDGKDVEVKTIYDGKERSNSIMDSLKVVQSLENKLFYEFEQQQQQINVADYFLKQMMRLYPIQDPFHIKIEDEYAKRFAMMDALVKKQNANQQSMALKVFKAYYKPVIPDWKQLDYWRDSVLALHYFDQFNPADSFYIHSNILPKKMDGYIALRTNKVDAYNRPIKSELQTGIAAQEFLKHTQLNALNFDFCLNYILKKFKKEHLDEAFLYVYDAFAKPKDGDCEQTKLSTLDIWKGRVNVLRNVQIGSVAPDIELEEGKLMLSGIESKYILLVFWATWCPHCTEAMPEVKNEINTYNKNHARSLTTIAISLDTDGEAWQAYVKAQQMYTFLNFTELKGWKSEVAKKYNVYATPTMILLDKDKKILAKPETVNELKNKLLTLN